MTRPRQHARRVALLLAALSSFAWTTESFASDGLEKLDAATAHAAIAESEGLVFVDVFAEW